MSIKAISFGLTGLGGYARWVCDQLLAATAHRTEGAPPIQFTAVCDPDLVAHAATVSKLRAAGITVVPHLDELLALPVDALWLPLPIHLHRPFTERCLKAGKAVLVEKPAAGAVEDVDAMIAARDQSRLPVAVGFQNLFDPSTWAVKEKLLAGAIGKPLSASVVTCWPRSSAYFARTKWAGRLKHDGAWVLDSPANNAMSHFLNLALFLLGPTETESAGPLSVSAELYRANPIENYDTCCMRYETAGGAKLLVAYTHASRTLIDPIITIKGDRGTMRFRNGHQYEIRADAAGRAAPPPLTWPASPHNGKEIVQGFAALMRGDRRPHVATLENARAHTIAINGASEASAVQTIPEEFIQTVTAADGHPQRIVPGIEEALIACGEDGKMLHESGRAKWSTPPGSKNLRGYKRFAGLAAENSERSGV